MAVLSIFKLFVPGEMGGQEHMLGINQDITSIREPKSAGLGSASLQSLV